MLKTLFQRIINLLLSLFREEPTGNNWADVSENVPDWVKEKIEELQNNDGLADYIFNERFLVIRGRYSKYHVRFINRSQYSAVYREKRKKALRPDKKM